MKKKIKRGVAVELYKVLSKMAFGHFNEDDLEKVMANYAELGKVAESYESLMKELGKRLYEGKEQDELQKFNDALNEARRHEEIEKRVAAVEAVKNEYPELFELLNKQMKVEASLKGKEISIEVEPIDRKAFTKAILKAKPDIEQGLFEFFEPFYIEEEKVVENDFSELDELLK